MTRVTTFSLILLLMCVGLSTESVAATRIGIQFTAEELALWQSRRTSSTLMNGISFASIYTTRILPKADSFKNSTSHPNVNADGRWNPSFSGCFPNAQNPAPGRQNGLNLMAAAFVFLLNGNPADPAGYGEAVRQELLAQAAVASTNFNDLSKWCVVYGSDNPGVELSAWTMHLLLAYDYIRAGGLATLTSANKITIETWLHGFARYWLEKTELQLSTNVFPGRLSDNYACTGNQCGNPTILGITHFGGFNVTNAIQSFSNRIYGGTAFVAMIAKLVAPSITVNSTFGPKIKRIFEESIKYSHFGDGTQQEKYRWGTDGGCTGPGIGSAWGHSMMQDAPTAVIADVFGRAGDMTLYTYTSSAGVEGTAGGPRGLLDVARIYAREQNGTLLRYASTTGTPAGCTLNGNDHGEGLHPEDLTFMLTNIYYRNAEIRTAMERTITGTLSSCGGLYCLGGGWGYYVDLPFMYGKLDNGESDPFTVGAPDTLAPKAPTSLTPTVISSSQINLAWVAPTQNSDNSSLTDLAGYRITFCTGASCTPASPLPSGDLGLVTSTSHTGLTASTVYGYRIEAKDTATSPNYSTPSTPVQYATTSAPTSPWTGSIASSSDDAEQDVTGGAVSITSSDMDLVLDGGVNLKIVGLRFTNLQVPQAAVLTSATKIQFTGSSGEVPNSGSPTLTFKVQAAVNPTPATFTTATNNLSSRTLRGESVVWNPGTWTQATANAASLTPDLSSLLQPLVDDPAWTLGKDVVFIITGPSGWRGADSWDFAGASTTAAQLTVAWSTVDTTAPDPPTSLQLTPGSNAATDINLAWTAPTVNAGDLVGYNIYSCIDSAGPADCSPTTLLDTLIGLGTTYPASPLTPATTYGFAVSAYDGQAPANESTKSSPTMYLTTGAGTPIVTGVAQATYQCSFPDHALTAQVPRSAVGSPCRAPSPSVIRLHTALRNTDVSDAASTAHTLYCREGAGAWTAIVDNSCAAFNLCYADDAFILSNQVLNSNSLPLGGTQFATGRAKHTSLPAEPLVVPAGGQLEYLHVLAIKEALTPGTSFECCEREADGDELDDCVEASILVGGPQQVSR